MRKLTLTLLAFGFVFVFMGFATAADNSSDVMTVEANIFESSVGINVPDRIAFGDIAKGYISERQSADISNTGTTDILITPELANSSEEIFSYLSFREILDDPLTRVGFFDFEILRPATIGVAREENLYLYLDLTNYIGEIEEEQMNHEAEVIFWAMEI
ncbi:hypothetical protein HOD88_01700 [archaeon]|jgi:hypothetical protein|nr:hypothetical protein [archaeon]